MNDVTLSNLNFPIFYPSCLQLWINDNLDDYDEDNFQMFWKLEQNGDTQTVASWEPDAADEDSVIYYLQHSLENRVTVIPSFDGIFSDFDTKLFDFFFSKLGYYLRHFNELITRIWTWLFM